MRLDDEAESSNVEDRRGISMGGVGGVGIGTVLVALAASYFLGIDPSAILGFGQQAAQPPASQVHAPPPPEGDEQARFVSRVLGSTERVWTEVFAANGRTYRKAHLVLFNGATRTSCGTGQTAMGPFYCAGDERVYIDLQFYDQLVRRFHAPGNAAQAYVIAHEVGHHVQNLMGTMDKAGSAQQHAHSRGEANSFSVRLELQADCFAGVWMAKANESKHILESGDVESIVTAATAIGDDTLQKRAQGYVVPDSFTHGTAAQRVRWLKRGLETGQPGQCNTFTAQEL
jgi:predicted metalloprotease